MWIFVSIDAGCCFRSYAELFAIVCYDTFWLFQGVPGDLATEGCGSLSQGRGALADGSQVKVARCELTMSSCCPDLIVESLSYHPLFIPIHAHIILTPPYVHVLMLCVQDAAHVWLLRYVMYRHKTNKIHTNITCLRPTRAMAYKTRENVSRVLWMF